MIAFDATKPTAVMRHRFLRKTRRLRPVFRTRMDRPRLNHADQKSLRSVFRSRLTTVFGERAHVAAKPVRMDSDRRCYATRLSVTIGR